MKFFENLKRLLGPRTQAPAETTRQPTADRPPPLETAPSREPASVEATPAPDEVAEIRALLEAVARDAVAVGAKVVWFQPGTDTDVAAAVATKGGLTVIRRRCMAVTHGLLGLGPGPHARAKS